MRGQLIGPLKSGWRKRPHRHSTAVLTGVDEGVVSITTDKGAWVLTRRTVAYIPPGVPHASHMMRGYAGWVLELPRRFHVVDSMCVLNTSDLLISAARRMAARLNNRRMSRAEQHIAQVILDELRSASAAEYLRVPMPETNGLRVVANKVMANPGNSAGLDQWASIAAMSRRNFTRSFLRDTGLSFIEWRQRVRVQKGLQMLSSGESVTQVALDLGYQNTSSFIAVFRKHLKQTPGAFHSSFRFAGP